MTATSTQQIRSPRDLGIPSRTDGPSPERRPLAAAPKVRTRGRVKRFFFWLVILAMLGGGGYAGYQTWFKTTVVVPLAPLTAKVQRAPIREIVQSTGKIVSNLDVDIKCKASGTIIKLPFDLSQSVRKGDLLVELDPIDEQPNVQRARSSLAASQARLAEARQNLLIAQETLIVSRVKAAAAVLGAQAKEQDARSKAARMKELLEQKLCSLEDNETAQTAAAGAAAELKTAQAAVDDLKNQEMAIETKRQEINLAQSQVDSDKISLDDALQRLADTKVVAPINGVIAALGVQIGNIISSGTTNVGGGTTLMTISDLSHMFVLAAVDESDIGRVALGQDVQITADSFPGREFSGKVMRIGAKGLNTSNVVTFEVKIEVTSANKTLLKPEMTGNVEIVVAERLQSLIAPIQAIHRRQGTNYATVLQPSGATEERPVDIGISDINNYEIVKGLADGDTVVLPRAEVDSRWKSNAQNMFRSSGPMGGRR